MNLFFRSFLRSSVLAWAVMAVNALAGSVAQAAPTKIRWFGQAAFEIITPSGKILLVDPWITNPLNPKGKEDVAQLEKADYILLTHGHGDHVGDTVTIAKKTGAHLISSLELATNLMRIWGFPAAQAGMDTAGNAGGELKLADGDITIAFTQAVHSSGLDYPDAAGEKETRPIVYGGSPVGFVITIKNGPTIYHTGDTAYFKDMETIGEIYHPDLALINIGGHFGMEPAQAAKAAAAVKAKTVVPMHFKTFPILTQDAGPFMKLLDAKSIGHIEMQPGSWISFEGKKLQK